MTEVLSFQSWQLQPERVRELVSRCDLVKALLRRSIEEEIVALVQPDLQPDDLTWENFRKSHQLALGDEDAIDQWLKNRHWSLEDLCLDLLRQPALNRFMEQRYGPGVEEHFLDRKNDLDVVIYSLLRVRDPGVARELWIQLSEKEATFSELASRYSDGPEAQTKGVIGPLRLGNIESVLANRLRSMRAGELRAPELLGEWHVLLRLENITPARLDDTIRALLLQEQMDQWINERIDAILTGTPADPLHFDQDP